MKIKFFSEFALDNLRANLKRYQPFFRAETNHEFLNALQEDIGELALKESNIEFPDNVCLSTGALSSDEVNNVKKIYGNLRDLPRSIASDQRLWAGMCIDRFWSYTRIRWGFDKEFTAENLRDHFLFNGQSKKAYTRNAISRLWWIGALTYDEARNDPYEITAFTLRDSDYVVNLLERNFSSNRIIFLEFVDAVEQARKEGVRVSREEIRALCKYLNLLGGVYVLDALPEGMIREKIYQRARDISEKSNAL